MASTAIMSEADAKFVADTVATIRQRYAELGPEGFTVQVDPESDVRIPFGSSEHVEKLEALKAKHADDALGAMFTGITDGVLEFIEELHAT